MIEVLLAAWEWLKTEGVGFIVAAIPTMGALILLWIKRKLKVSAEQQMLQIDYMDRLAKKEDLRPYIEMQNQKISKLEETLNGRDSAIQALFEIQSKVFSNIQSLAPEIRDEIKTIYNKTAFGAREDEISKLNVLVSTLKEDKQVLSEKLEKVVQVKKEPIEPKQTRIRR